MDEEAIEISEREAAAALRATERRGGGVSERSAGHEDERPSRAAARERGLRADDWQSEEPERPVG
jgi:hypothetical protein